MKNVTYVSLVAVVLLASASAFAGRYYGEGMMGDESGRGTKMHHEGMTGSGTKMRHKAKKHHKMMTDDESRRGMRMYDRGTEGMSSMMSQSEESMPGQGGGVGEMDYDKPDYRLMGEGSEEGQGGGVGEMDDKPDYRLEDYSSDYRG
jgi:hypothetical protein